MAKERLSVPLCELRVVKSGSASRDDEIQELEQALEGSARALCTSKDAPSRAINASSVFGVGRREWPIKPPGTATLEPTWGMQEAGTTVQPGLSHGNCRSALDPCCETRPIPGLPGQPSEPTTHFDANFWIRRVFCPPGHPKVASSQISSKGGAVIRLWL
jgi:hypothetical protein